MPASHLVLGAVHTPSWKTPRLESLINRSDRHNVQPHRSCGTCHCSGTSPLTRFCCLHPGTEDLVHNYRYTKRETTEPSLTSLPYRGKATTEKGGAAWADILNRNLSTRLYDSPPSPDNERMVSGSNIAVIKYLGITDEERESLFDYLSGEEDGVETRQDMIPSPDGPPAKRIRRRQDERVIHDPKEMESWVWQSFDEFCSRL